MRFTVGPHPCEQLTDFVILSVLLGVFPYGLTCIFPMNNDIKYIFMYLLAICRYFLVKCLFIILLFANIPFVITTYFAQDTLKLCIYSYFSSNLTPSSFSLYCLITCSSYCVVLKVLFISFTFNNWNFFVKKNSLFSLIYLFSFYMSGDSWIFVSLFELQCHLSLFILPELLRVLALGSYFGFYSYGLCFHIMSRNICLIQGYKGFFPVFFYKFQFYTLHLGVYAPF